MVTVGDLKEHLLGYRDVLERLPSLLSAIEMLNLPANFEIDEDPVIFLRTQLFTLLSESVQNGEERVWTADVARAYADIVFEYYDDYLP